MLLVTGATGNFGSAAVDAAERAGLAFRALVHSAEKAEPLRRRGIDVAIGDMARADSLAQAFRGIDKLLLIGPMSPALVELEAQTLGAAGRASVARVVKISALSVGTPHQAGLGDLHAAAEARLRDAQMEWTALRPAATMGSPLHVGRIEDGVLYAPAARGTAAYVAPSDVAELALHILERGGHSAQAYSITGPAALELGQIAEIVTARTGRSLRYEPISEEEYAERLARAGVAQPLIAISQSFFRRVRAGAFGEVLHTVETLLGRAGTSYSDWAARDAVRFLP